MEGCTAPKFSTATLHSAVVELVALKGARSSYITVQNWSSNVFNLVTKRGLAHRGRGDQVDRLHIGSRLTMKYPGVVLKGRKSRGEVISIALANDGQHQDTGARWSTRRTRPPRPSSRSPSRSPGPRDLPRCGPHPAPPEGLQEQHRVRRAAHQHNSRTDTYPAITVRGDHHKVQHEASVSKVSAEQIFYMQQARADEGQAMSLSVNGFSTTRRQFPMEYSVELKRLIDLEMEGSSG